MKKALAVLIAVILAFSALTVMSFADDQVAYDQPFAFGTMGSELYRIPAIYTLNNGSVIAAADMRYSSGSDAPGNLDTLVAISENGYTDWKYTVVNRFDDYADGLFEKNSASFIDSAIVQSKETDRIFIITDAFMSGIGYPQTKQGTGFVDINGKKCLSLTDGSNNYYVADFDGDLATVFSMNGTATEYSVDSEYALYKNGEALTVKQIGSDEIVKQNVFYASSELTLAVKTSHLWLRYSDDNGATWSAPVLLNAQVKSDKESFLGVGPGRGFVTEVNGKERIMFCVYDTVGGENCSVIYSDDNGMTWNRGGETKQRLGVLKTSEAQIVTLPDGTLRMYARDNCKFVAYADSTDGGVTWSKFRADRYLSANGNCMVSFINYSKKINGKNVIIGSFVSATDKRADGVVVVGLVNSDNSVEWISKYHVNNGFFAYSCLTELSDGNIGYLYEDEAAHIEYGILSIDANGNVSEINGNNREYSSTSTFWTELWSKIKTWFYDVLFMLGIM